MTTRNRISFVVTFDKPKEAKVSDLREFIQGAIENGYPYEELDVDQWPDMTTLTVHRLRKPMAKP